MKNLWAVMGAFVLVGLLATSAAQAAADWEWSRDKGWTQGLGQAKSTPAEQLKSAWALEKDGQYLNATREYFLLLKTYPDSDESGIGLQRLANCLFMMENYYDSYKALEQVIKSYPLSAKKSYLIKLEFLIGRKFQDGARKDLLNAQEPAATGCNSAVEIFKSVINNDPVGPYAGAATLAIAECYKKLGDAPQGIVYCDRVISEFSLSTDLVGRARILKTTFEVLQGKANVDSVKRVIQETEAAKADAAKKNPVADSQQSPEQAPLEQDVAPVANYQDDIRELEEEQARKMWDAAAFYKSRGSRDSLTAYKFSLEQIIIRFPNTSYAVKARKVVGYVKIPPKKNDFLKVHLPFVKGPKEPNFLVQGNTSNHVDTQNLPVPGVEGSADKDLTQGSTAGVIPVAPPKLITPQAPTRSAAGVASSPAGSQDAVSTVRASADVPQLGTLGSAESTSSLPSGRPGETPPGESGAGLRPGARRTPAPARSVAASASAASASTAIASAAPATDSAPGTALAPAFSDRSDAVQTFAVPQARDMPVPDDSGSSVIPAARRTPARVAAPKVAPAPVAKVPAPAAMPEEAMDEEPVAAESGSTRTVTDIPPIPLISSGSSSSAAAAPVAPAVDPAVKAAAEAAESKARSVANDAAAKSGSWNFSKDFE